MTVELYNASEKLLWRVYTYIYLYTSKKPWILWYTWNIVSKCANSGYVFIGQKDFFGFFFLIQKKMNWVRRKKRLKFILRLESSRAHCYLRCDRRKLLDMDNFLFSTIEISYVVSQKDRLKPFFCNVVIHSTQKQ